MIDQVNGISTHVLGSRYNKIKELDEGSVSKPNTDNVSEKKIAVPSVQGSVQKPSANTQQGSYNTSLKDLLRQGRYNYNSNSNSNSAAYMAEIKRLQKERTIMKRKKQMDTVSLSYLEDDKKKQDEGISVNKKEPLSLPREADDSSAEKSNIAQSQEHKVATVAKIYEDIATITATDAAVEHPDRSVFIILA